MAQGEGNNWYFGQNAGIDFNPATPVALTNGALNTAEGCSSTSDNNGNILFYTDGTQVYNANHLIMPNGNGLFGNSSSSQSAIIVQNPGASNLYYIFTVDYIGGSNGLCYSEVDMNLQGGLGDVTSNINIPIVLGTTEKVTAVQHANGIDYWIITYTTLTNSFHSYLLTPSGLALTPIISSLGLPSLAGYLKSNLQGTKIASARIGISTQGVQIFDFDNNTGILSNELSFLKELAYGVEFSPNGNLLYVSCTFLNNSLFQYNLQAGTGSIADIINSEVNISQIGIGGALQIGPDFKIYQAIHTSSSLGVINNPNIIGAGCNYNSSGFSLGTQVSYIGLPTFFNSVYGIQTIYDFNICLGDSVYLYDPNFQNYTWALANSPNNIISTDSSITVSPNSDATYILYNGIDTVNFNITVFSPINIDLGNDIVQCNNDSLILVDLNISSGTNYSYLWQNGSTNDTLVSSNTGTYWLQVNSPGCSSSDTIIISNENITANLTNLIPESCLGTNDGSATIQNISNLSASPLTLIWLDPSGNVFDSQSISPGGSSTQNTLYSGIWQITIESSNGCLWDTSFVISAGTSVNISTNINNPQCFGTSNGSITAFSNSPGNWSFLIEDENDNLMNSVGTNTANSLPAGSYTLTVTDNDGCDNSTTVILIDPQEIELNLSLENPLCHKFETGFAIVDTVFNPQGAYTSISYDWDPNPNGNSGNGLTQVNVDNLGAGEYSLIVTDSIGCSAQFIFNITQPEPLYGSLQVASPTYCRTSGFQKGRGEVTVTNTPDSSGTGNIIYQWENIANGDIGTSTTFVVDEPGWMKATLKDDNNCIFIDSIYVDSLNPKAIFIPISEQFNIPGIYEGTEDVEIEFINESINFSKPTYPLSDTTFKWNFFTNQEPGGIGNWFFSFDYNEKIDTIFKGEQIYEVCLVAKNWNGCADTTCKEIIVHVKPILIAPNVFTPGNNNGNPNFFFPSIGIETFNCIIYDRYGIKVFEFLTIEDQWDGTHFKTDKSCVDGVYFYQYNGISTDNTVFKGEGSVTLISD